MGFPQPSFSTIAKILVVIKIWMKRQKQLAFWPETRCRLDYKLSLSVSLLHLKSMNRILTSIWPFLLASLGGLLAAFCFAPFNLADFVWGAPGCWLAALWLGLGERRRKRKSFFIAWVAGCVFWAVNLKWLFSVAGPAYLLLVAYLAIFLGVFGVFASSVGNPFRKECRDQSRVAIALRSLAFAAVNAGLWCGLEWLRGLLFTGFGWNGLGVAFHSRLPLAQGAELVGVTGLSFLPVFVAGVCVQVGVRLVAGVKEGKLTRHWDFAAAMLILIACFTYGVTRLSMVNRAASEELKVLLVQLDTPQFAHKVALSPEDVHAGFEEETLLGLKRVEEENEKRIAQAIEAGESVVLERVDWVMWPEVVLYGPILTTEESRQMLPMSWETIERMQEAGVRTLIAGIQEYEGESIEAIQAGEATPYNTMIGVTGDGDLQVHRKQHLVIYGEFIPFVDSVGWLGAIYEKVAGAPWAGNMGRGSGNEGFSLPGGGGEIRVIPSICFEDTVPRVARKFSDGGKEVIVNITNDGWFGESEGSRQHFQNALFRSIELRRPLLRAANRGVTGVVSATGSLVDYQTGERQVLENEEGLPFHRGSILVSVRVPTTGGPTLYARAGDWFAVLGLIGALTFALVSVRRSKAKTKNEKQ